MKITFQDRTQIAYDILDTPVKNQSVQAAKGSNFAATIASFDGEKRITGREPEQKKVLSGSESDSEIREKQKLAGLMSFQDYQEMLREGFEPSEEEDGETVTILDKIKAELIKSGQNIVGYTDSIDMNVLSAALGDSQLAQKAMDACRSADIPVNDENLKELKKALGVGESILTFGEEQTAFLLENELEPTIFNLSLAAASGAVSKGSVAESGISMEELAEFLEKNHVECTEENMKNALWLLEQGIPIREDNLEKKAALDALEFPLSAEILMRTGVGAMAQGKPAVEGSVISGESVWEKSVRIYEEYTGPGAEKLISSAIQREEIRLVMTIDANKALLESGFEIDTHPIEETIDALKEVRRQKAMIDFPDAAEPEILEQRYMDTKDVLAKLQTMPVETIGVMRDRLFDATLPDVTVEGERIKADYQAAGERYETMMTTPRADLGDRIKNAFRNVDDLLKENGFAVTEENRQAARVLGYCRSEFNEENLQTVREGLRTMKNLVESMTPKAVLQMIRDGVNPLESSIKELQAYFKTLPGEYLEESEKYSHYLFQLEHHHEITEEEKSAYLGCFRLLRQVEKSDGAVVGDLLFQNAELSFKNLLSAIRSRSARGTDTVVDDERGSASVERGIENSISAQIERGFDLGAMKEQVESMIREETTEAYEKMRYEEYMESLSRNPEAVVQELQQAGLAQTPNRVEALSLIWELQGRYWPGSTAGEREENPTEETQLTDDLEAFETDLYENLKEAKKQVVNRTFETEDRIDLKALQLVHKQLTVMEELAPVNDYYFSMGNGEEEAKVHMKLSENGEEKGLILLTVESEKLGSLSGRLELRGDQVYGYLVGNHKETVMKLEAMTDIFDRNLPEGITYGRVDFIHEESGKTIVSRKGETEARTQDPATLFKVATGFLNTVFAS